MARFRLHDKSAVFRNDFLVLSPEQVILETDHFAA
jgi:hypothetical protein